MAQLLRSVTVALLRRPAYVCFNSPQSSCFALFSLDGANVGAHFQIESEDTLLCSLCKIREIF